MKTLEHNIEQLGTFETPTATTPIKETNPVAFFEIAYQTFERAAKIVGGSIDHSIKIGKQVIQLRFAGSALISRIIPALEHLVIQPQLSPALTICIWDSASTGIHMPPPPWPPTAYGVRGEIEGYNTNRIYTFYQPGIDILQMIDLERNLAIYWVDKVSRIPYWESSFPMRTILHWWTGRYPLQLMHAGAVGLPTGGILLAGKSGSGKSTTTLKCLDSDLLYAGDDYVLVDVESSPFVYSLYNTAKLESNNIHRLPHLQPLISNSDQLATEKALIHIKDHYPEKLSSGFPIRAILLPRVTGLCDTRLTKASPIKSLRALAPTTIFHLPRTSHEAFRKMTRLVNQVPSYYLELGTDLGQIPQVVLGLLNRVTR